MRKEFEKLIEWSLEKHRDIPWRQQRSLYVTLVSEIMLQQTTVATVRNKFASFLKTFPTLQSLAQASESQLRVAWKGLGYYRRCRNLKAAADVLIEKHQGHFPTSEAELLKIPGIGAYTAGALLAIGMDRPALAIDANLERVLARFLGLNSTPKGPKLHKEIKQHFESGDLKFLHQISARNLNEALMDLGREVCTAREARCLVCPLVKKCEGYAQGNPLKIPNQEGVKKVTKIELQLGRILMRQKSKVFLTQRKKGTWLEGQWELPSFTIAKAQLSQFTQYEPAPSLLKKVISTKPVKQFKTTITNYKIVNHVFEVEDEAMMAKITKSLDGKWRVVDENSDISQATKKSL